MAGCPKIAHLVFISLARNKCNANLRGKTQIRSDKAKTEVDNTFGCSWQQLVASVQEPEGGSSRYGMGLEELAAGGARCSSFFL